MIFRSYSTLVFVLCVFFGFFEASAQEAKGVGLLSKPVSQGKTYALIIGVGNYQQLPRLSFATADAFALRDYLIAGQKVPQSNLFCLVDDSATNVNIFDKLYLISDSLQPGDNFLFYFSGHGDWESKISDNSLLLLSKAPTQNYLRYPDQFINTQVLNQFITKLAERNVKTILIADACRSGNLSGGKTGAELTNLQLKKAWKNDIRILSCMPDELSYEDKRWGGGRGVFSYYLTLGLQGMTRNNPSQSFDLTVGELRSYMEENLRRETDGRQNPLFEGDSRLVLARVNESNKIKEAIRKTTSDNNSIAMARGFLDTSSATYKELLYRLKNAIEERRLVGPSASSAFALYQQLIRLAPAYAVQEQKALLLSALQKSFQDYSEKLYNEIGYPAEALETLKMEMQAGMKLADKNLMLYHIFYSKKLFVEASLITYRAQHGFEKSLTKPELLAAADSLLKATSLTPFEPLLYKKLSDCYLSIEPLKAIGYLKTYTSLLPKDASAYNAFGLAYYQIGEFNNAAQSFQTAIRLDRNNGKYYYNLGMCYQKMNMPGEAGAMFRKSQSIYQPNEGRDY